MGTGPVESGSEMKGANNQETGMNEGRGRKRRSNERNADG